MNWESDLDKAVEMAKAKLRKVAPKRPKDEIIRLHLALNFKASEIVNEEFDKQRELLEKIYNKEIKND